MFFENPPQPIPLASNFFHYMQLWSRYPADQPGGPFASITRSKTLGEQGTASSQSFSRLESTRPALLGRSRARTLQNGTIPENMVPEANPSSQSQNENAQQPGDVFEKVSDNATLARDVGCSESRVQIPDSFDELPQDVVSVTERYEF